jgi:hypothetical protein
VGRSVWVEVAKRLRWEAEGLVEVAATRRTTRHRWADVTSLRLARGRWDVLDLDITSPWFDTVPLHVEVELASGQVLRRRSDRDRLVRFGRLVAGVDPGVGGRPVTHAFLAELVPVLGWSGLPGGGAVPFDADDGWDPPDPDLL